MIDHIPTYKDTNKQQRESPLPFPVVFKTRPLSIIPGKVRDYAKSSLGWEME